METLRSSNTAATVLTVFVYMYMYTYTMGESAGRDEAKVWGGVGGALYTPMPLIPT